MTVRAGTPVTSLRSKVITSLAVTLIGPLLVIAAGIGVWGPRHARSSAQDAATHAARSAAVALTTKCEAVGESATAAARQAASYATVYGTIPPDAAQAIATGSAAHRPDASVAVFNADWKLLAVVGVAAGRKAAQAGGYGASCSAGLPGNHLRVAGLAERREVRASVAGKVVLVGHVVLWVPVDDVGLRSLRTELGGGGELSVLGADDRVVASSASDADQVRLGEVAVSAGARAGGAQVAVGAPSLTATATRIDAGTVDGTGYAVAASGPEVPFRLLATVPVAGAGLMRALSLILLLIGLLALLPIRALADRLSRPVTDELAETVDELQLSRGALADTLVSFGAVLEHTHNLEKLLDTVAGACLPPTGAVAGMVLLAEGPAGPPSAAPPLRARGAARGPGPVALAAFEALPGFAEQHFGALGATSAAEPLFVQLPQAGPVVAVPIRSGGQVIGLLVLARGEGATEFDALALPLVRTLADRAGTAVANVRLHEEVRRMSVTDPLTGVGNVRHLTSTLSREVAGATRFDRPLTVLMLDLDHFKQVNDTLGHPFGDQVLREFAHRVLTCVREMDTVARCGGEEFAVVLPDTDVAGGCRVAERVIKAVREEPFRHGEIEQMVTVSIGVAAFPVHGRSATQVLQAADEGLYAAKHAGRDRWEVARIPPSAAAVPQAG